jgi:hypothetical protein
MMKLTRPPLPLRLRSLAVTAALAPLMAGRAVARPWSQPEGTPGGGR